MIAAALLLLQAAGGVPGFAGVAPSGEEGLAIPHIADAHRATDAATRARSLDAALALLPRPTRFRGAFQCMRGSMLLGADQVANRAVGLAAIAECRRLLPDVAFAQRIASDAAFMQKDFRGGAALLTQALTRDPRLARGLRQEQLDAVFRQLGYAGADAERQALILALARTDFARNDPALYSGWVRESVLERVGKGDLDGAAALLPYVVDPGDGLAMLVDRRYALLWSFVDAWAGGNLEAQRDALVAGTRAGYDLAPTLGRARDAAAALARNGHLDEGVALLDRAITAFGAPRDDYDYARGVVRLASLRAQAGERDPARILAPMEAALANGVTGPMLVNVVPNLAMAQVALGRPAAALATLDRYPTTPGKVEVRAAYGYFVALRGCALDKAGRAAEARAAFATVRRDYSANNGAVDLAVACGGTDAEVANDWIRRADDPDSRTGALMAMTAARAGLPSDPLSLTDARLRAVADRPDVSGRFARYARPLPAGYLPALRRMSGERQAPPAARPSP